MKLNIFIIALLLAHNLSASQQKPNLKRAGSPIQNLDERPNTRTTTTSSSAQSLDEETNLKRALNKLLLQETKAGNLRRIQALFNHQNSIIPDINARDPNTDLGHYFMVGMTPLMIAADRGYADVVRFLIKQGADLNLETEGKLTALKIALEDRFFKYSDDEAYDEELHDYHPEIAEILVQAGADISTGSRHSTPLWYAYFCYNNIREVRRSFVIKLIKNMIERGAKLNDEFLQDAVFQDLPELVTLFLRYGANPYARDNKKQNAFDIAQKHSLPEVKKLLADYEKLQTPEHIARLQAVAQKSMQGLSHSARHEGMEEPAMLVQQYLRPDYRTEALQRENKEKEEKDNKERSSLAPMTDEK